MGTVDKRPAETTKQAPTFDQILLGRQAWEMQDAFSELTSALTDTISAILWDPETGDKAGAIRTALGSFETALEGEITSWLAAPAAVTKATALAERDRARDRLHDTLRFTIHKALLARAGRARQETPMPTTHGAETPVDPQYLRKACRQMLDDRAAELAKRGVTDAMDQACRELPEVYEKYRRLAGVPEPDEPVVEKAAPGPAAAIYAEAETRAAALVAKQAGLSPRDAILRVFGEDRELYDRYRAAVRLGRG